MRYVKPFRVGRKQKRAVLDGEGKEVVLFHKGDEDMAEAYGSFLNGETFTMDELYNKYPWLQREIMRRELEEQGLNIKIKK